MKSFKIDSKKELREKCYRDRDIFYSCVQLKTTSDVSTDCTKEREVYTTSCPKTWVKYWEERFRKGQPLRTPGGSS